MKFDMLCREKCDERTKLRQKGSIMGQESPFHTEMVHSRKLLYFYRGRKSEEMETTRLEVLGFYIRTIRLMEYFKIMRSNNELKVERNWCLSM